ncbi:UV-stimulated scaffold protein A-like isoform X2 [Bacillus rossius redtenbacheri]|uniref:UV-stimulated scaffold protein A-like isoform X2 n=1 Tax=Bacillus rossius redtenbacheri TaxID=93214 RepID=UPI002FDCDD6D
MSCSADSDLCKQLSQHIEKLTHSGKNSLEEKLLKEVKNICKLSDNYVEHAYHHVMHHLGKNHAEVRFSAFQLCSELFQRSHAFREQLLPNLRQLFEMTVESCPDRPLPPPRPVALKLKRLALHTVLEWNKTFGRKYKELQLGYNFLAHRKRVDFASLELESSAERARQQGLERRKNLINESNIKKVRLEIKELESEISASAAALDNCISLLLPPPDEFFVHEEESVPCSDNVSADTNLSDGFSRPDIEHPSVPTVPEGPTCNESDGFESGSDDPEVDDRGEDEEIDLRSHGMFNTNFNIEIKLHPGLGDANQINVTDENAVIVENARDHFTLINKRYLPCVKKWILILTKSSGTPEDIRKVTDIKQSLEAVISKFLKLNLQKSGQIVSDDSSDSDFEDVEEKVGFEETAKEPPLPAPESPSLTKTSKKLETPEWNILPKENEKEDPTTAQSTISKLLAAKPSGSSANSDGKGAEEHDPHGSLSARSDGGPGNKAGCQQESRPSTSQTDEGGRKAKLLAIAPKLPYDIDLYHWEDEKLTAPTMLAVKAENSRFWSSTNIDEMEEIPNPEGSSCLRTRVIEFTGKFEPVKRACRAPLGNGKLCPRHDSVRSTAQLSRETRRATVWIQETRSSRRRRREARLARETGRKRSRTGKTPSCWRTSRLQQELI